MGSTENDQTASHGEVFRRVLYFATHPLKCLRGSVGEGVEDIRA